MNFCFEAETSHSQCRRTLCAPEQWDRNPATAGVPSAPCRSAGLRDSRNWVTLSLYPIIDFQPLIQITKPTAAASQAPCAALTALLTTPHRQLHSAAQSTSDQEPLARYHRQGVPSQTSCSLQKQAVSLLTLNCWAFSALNPAGTVGQVGLTEPGW